MLNIGSDFKNRELHDDKVLYLFSKVAMFWLLSSVTFSTTNLSQVVTKGIAFYSQPMSEIVLRWKLQDYCVSLEVWLQAGLFPYSASLMLIIFVNELHIFLNSCVLVAVFSTDLFIRSIRGEGQSKPDKNVSVCNFCEFVMRFTAYYFEVSFWYGVVVQGSTSI